MFGSLLWYLWLGLCAGVVTAGSRKLFRLENRWVTPVILGSLLALFWTANLLTAELFRFDSEE